MTSLYSAIFNACLTHLGSVLERSEQKNLFLNWEESHFIVKKGIIAGHIVPSKG